MIVRSLDEDLNTDRVTGFVEIRRRHLPNAKPAIVDRRPHIDWTHGLYPAGFSLGP